MFPQGEILLDALNVRVVGTGHRVVVLAHGFGCTQAVWEEVLPTLLQASSCKVVLFDLPGACTTNADDFDSALFDSFHGFAQVLVALLQELQVRHCTYVGHSMSGMIGCIASAMQPDLIEDLVLLSASPRYLNDGDYYGGFEQEDLDQLFEAMAADFQGWAAGFAPLVVGVDDPDTSDRFADTLAAMPAHVACATARTIFETDNRGVLGQVKAARAHIIQTSKDLAVPNVVGDHMRSHVASKQPPSLDVLPTEGHLPQLTAPHLLSSTLLRVLQL